jgi:hypothetical protein
VHVRAEDNIKGLTIQMR